MLKQLVAKIKFNDGRTFYDVALICVVARALPCTLSRMKSHVFNIYIYIYIYIYMYIYIYIYILKDHQVRNDMLICLAASMYHLQIVCPVLEELHYINFVS